MVVLKAGNGTYFSNRGRPPASTSRSRGSPGSLVVKIMATDESIRRNCPAELVRLKISANKRGLALLIESQHGVRKATGTLLEIWFNKSTQPWNVFCALVKLPWARIGQG